MSRGRGLRTVQRGAQRGPSRAGPLSARTIALVLASLFIWQLLLSMGQMDLFARGQTEPPASGDWIIFDTTVKTKTTIDMKGNVTVKNNGVLTLDGVTLRFNSTASSEYRFVVEPGGRLTLKNTSVLPVSTAWGYTIDLRGKTDIINCTFLDGGMFLDPNIIKIANTDVLITRSRFERANGSSVFIYPGNSPKVNNNTIIGGEFGLFIADNIGALPNSSPNLANNTIFGTKNTAIYVGEKTTATIFGNKIFNPGNRGIHIQYSNAVVGHNYIANSTVEAAIFLYGNTNKPCPRIHNNTIVDSLIGFTVSGPAKGTFEDNIVYRSSERGVVLQWNPETSLLRNHIWNSMHDGIFLMHDADPLVKDNDFFDNDNNIRLESRSKGTFTNNTFRGGAYGVYSSQSAPIIDSNKFYLQTRSAFAITDTYYGHTPTFSNNIVMNTDVGIAVTQSNPLIQGNRIKYTNTSAIDIAGDSTPQVLNNTISYNKGSGITVHERAAPDIKENGLDHNIYGMTLLGAQMQVDDNRFEANDFAVICDQGTNSIFHNNTFASSTFFDFLVKGGSHPTVRSSPINKSHVAADLTSSLKVQWNVALRVVDTMGLPEIGATVTVYNRSMMVVSEKTATNGVLVPFTALEAEVTYDGIRSFGPFRMEIQQEDIRNTTIMNVDRDLNLTIYLDHPPLLSLSSINVNEDDSKFIDLGPFLTDADGDKKNIMISSSSPHVTIDNADKSMTVLYTDEESYDILLLNLTDGIKNITQQVIVNIKLVNDRPLFMGPINDTEVLEDQGWELNLSRYFTDEEDPQGLTFTVSVPDIVIDNITKMAHWDAEGGGMLTNIYIRCYDVSDELFVDSNPFTLYVKQVNDRPIYDGGLASTGVKENSQWKVNLMGYFTDEENPEGLVFTASDPRISIARVDPSTVWATWTPVEGNTSVFGLTFTAHDAVDYNLTVTSPSITLTYVPVDQGPVFVPSCLDRYVTRIYPGDTWNLVISNCFYDEEHDALIYSSNKPNTINITTDRYGRVWASYYPPKDATTDQVIQSLVFYAQQERGDARMEKAQTYSINFTYKVNTTGPPPEPKIIFVSAKIAPFVYGSIPLAIIATASAFYIHRRVKFHKYIINDVFLIFNDGRLVTHITGSGASSKLDKDILASMLTAIQDFVKDSFSGREISSLQEMKYGEQNIVIERGIFAYLSTVVKGNVTEKLKDDMKEALRDIERKYANVLECWDGDNKKLADIEDQLNKMLDKQPKNLLDLLRSY